MQTKLIQSQQPSPSQQPISLTVNFHTVMLCSVEAQFFRLICKAALLYPCAILYFSVVPEVLHGKWQLVSTGGGTVLS